MAAFSRGCYSRSALNHGITVFSRLFGGNLLKSPELNEFDIKKENTKSQIFGFLIEMNNLLFGA